MLRLRRWLLPILLLSACGTEEGEFADPSLPRGVPGRGWHELVIEGRVDELSLSPDGRIWLASAMGEVYAGDSIHADWRRVVRRDTTEDLLGSGQTFSRVTFFDADTGIITGMIRADSLSIGGDAYLRTTDGGASWKTLRIPDDQWIYHVFVRGHQAWMGGSSGSFLYSGDAGRSWRRVSQPFDGSSRLHRIFMEDDRSGIIGALGNAIRITRDGGVSWTALPTPLDQKLIPATRGEDHSDHRIEDLAYFGTSILAGQDGKVFVSRRDRTAWRELPGGMVTFAVDANGQVGYAVDTARHVFRFGPELRPVRISPTPLRAQVQHLAVHGAAAYLLDAEGALHRIDPRVTTSGYPRSRQPGRLPIVRVRRHAGILWGATRNHLYRSDDGQSWDLVGSAPFSIAGMAPRSPASILLWDGHGANAEMDTRTRAVVPVAALAGWDVVGVVEAPGLWVAYGGRQYETAERVEVAQTFAGGQFRGSREHGFVLVSRDRGATWRRVDEWPNTGVASVFVHEDGALTLFSYLGGVRRLSAGTYTAETRLAASGVARESVPYVQTVGALYFEDADNGWVDGWIHHVGDKRFTTRDGGRSWREERRRRNHFVQMVRAGSGWAASTGQAVYLLCGAQERRVLELGGALAMFGDRGGIDQEYRSAEILDLSADDEGNAVAYLADGTFWIIPPSGRPRRPEGLGARRPGR
jgi:photosystem II stability/assembly factor-like uncharacterized protein